MTDCEYIKLNTSIQTGSNANTLPEREDGTVPATIELRLPDGIFNTSKAGRKIENVKVQTSKFRISMQETPIAELPYDNDKSTIDMDVLQPQLDVYPFSIADDQTLLPNSLADSAFPNYKNHQIKYQLYKIDELNSPEFIQEINAVGNSYNQNIDPDNIFLPILKKNLFKITNHVMNLCVPSNHESLQRNGNMVLIKNVGTLQQMFQDALENAITFASSETRLYVNVFIILKSLITDEIIPKPDMENIVNLNDNEYYYWYFEVDSTQTYVKNNLIAGFKPTVKLNEQSFSISYDTACFGDIIPFIWNSQYIDTFQKPEQLLKNEFFSSAWGEPPLKRVYRYDARLDDENHISYSFNPDFVSRVCNIIANKSLAECFSFLPWIKSDAVIDAPIINDYRCNLDSNQKNEFYILDGTTSEISINEPEPVVLSGTEATVDNYRFNNHGTAPEYAIHAKQDEIWCGTDNPNETELPNKIKYNVVATQGGYYCKWDQHSGDLFFDQSVSGRYIYRVVYYTSEMRYPEDIVYDDCYVTDRHEYYVEESQEMVEFKSNLQPYAYECDAIKIKDENFRIIDSPLPPPADINLYQDESIAYKVRDTDLTVGQILSSNINYEDDNFVPDGVTKQQVTEWGYTPLISNEWHGVPTWEIYLQKPDNSTYLVHAELCATEYNSQCHHKDYIHPSLPAFPGTSDRQTITELKNLGILHEEQSGPVWDEELGMDLYVSIFNYRVSNGSSPSPGNLRTSFNWPGSTLIDNADFPHNRLYSYDRSLHRSYGFDAQAVKSITNYNDVRANTTLTFTWNNLPVVCLSPIASIVLSLQGLQVTQEIQPVNIQAVQGSSLTSTFPIVENYYSLAQTLRDLHDELVVTKDTFDDTPTYNMAVISGQDRTITLSAYYITKNGNIYQIYIPNKGVFSVQLIFKLIYYFV